MVKERIVFFKAGQKFERSEKSVFFTNMACFNLFYDFIVDLYGVCMIIVIKMCDGTVVFIALRWELHRLGQRRQRGSSGRGSGGQAGRPTARQPVDPVIAQGRTGRTCRKEDNK